MITIFTPTYNRAKTLPALFDSLKRQTSKNFEWVIVDDGSTDGTEKIIENFKEETDILINYRKTENFGKMSAVNTGIEMSKGEYFFIVDSDDYITDDAIEKIEFYSKEVPKEFGGLVFRKHNISAPDFPWPESKIIDSNPIEIFYKMKVLGDKAEVIKTEIMKKNKFPKIENEKFIPEGLIWNRIGSKYNFRYVNEIIYNFEYIADGYTQNFKKILKNNPRGFNLYYKEMLSYEIPFLNKVKFLMRYIQTSIYKFL